MRTDGRLAHSLPWTVAALICAYLPQVPTKPLWVTALLIACAGYRLTAERRRLRLTPTWARTTLGLASFLGVLYSYGGINGVSPGSALLAVMAALKLLETHSQRDQFVLLFISLFMMLASFLHGQHLWSLAYLFVAFGVTLAAWSAAARSGAPRAARWYAREALSGLGFALPLLLALWVLFPRVPGPFWAIPTDGGDARTGLSSTMSPGDITKLGQSNAVAFRVRFDTEIPAPGERYWRAIVMRDFDGRTWSADDPTRQFRSDNLVAAQGREIGYTVTLEPTGQHWLFALDMPVRWRASGVYRTRYQTLERDKPVDDRLEYGVSSALQYTAAPELASYLRSAYTRLPAQGNPAAREFADSLLAQSASAEDYIERVLSYFRDEAFFYTLSPPALGRDSVDEFLFTSRRGFCEHYASAFTYLMRAAGLPARVVAGYQGGEINPFGGHMVVRQSDAHAWSEVWFPGRGWLRVDPTAAVAPQRIEQNLDSALREFGERTPGAFDLPMVERMKLVWDVINARWNEWVLGFGPETQKDFFAWLGLEDADWRDLVFLLAISLVTLMGLLTLWLAWRARPPVSDAASRAYRALQRRAGTLARRGEAPLQWAGRAGSSRPQHAAHIRSAVALYLRVRYADDETAMAPLRRAVAALPRPAKTIRRRRAP